MSSPSVSPLMRYIGVALLLVVGAVQLEAQAPEPLFSDTAAPGLGVPAADPRVFVVRSRTATLNLGALDRALASPATSTFTLNLFDDASLAMTFDRVETSSFGLRTWSGHITDRPLSTVALTLNGDSVLGMVTDGTTLFEVAGLGGGVHRIDQLDMSAMPIDRDEVVVHPSAGAGGPPQAPALSMPSVVSTVDIFVYYSTALKDAVGLPTVQSRINQYIANANTAYIQSGIEGQLNLVGIAELPVPEPLDSEVLLDAFSVDPGVINQRNASNADLVALLVGELEADPGFISCGIAWVGFAGSTDAAFSITASRSECVHTFAHEVGHNLGGQHATEDGTIPGGNFPTYARGYKAPDHSFRTVMAYDCTTAPSCPRILNFSNPAVSVNPDGPPPLQTTGTASARNANRLAELFPQVSAYRAGGPGPQPPGPPVNLQVFTNGFNVTLQWQHATGGPLNYIVVAGTGPGLSNIGQVPVGLATSVSATIPAGAYFVRIFAQNGAGVSTPSNEVSFTLGATTPPGPPLNLTANVVGTTVSLGWQAPNTGGPPSDYLLFVGTAPGQSNVVSALPFSGTSLIASGAPVGTFFIRVHSRNTAGVSGPSNEVSATVGAGCTVPSAPQSFTVTKTGFDLLLTWSPPAVGGPSFTYGLQAGNAPGAANLFNGSVGSLTSIGGTVPAGSYFFRVLAANGCGIGPATGEIAVNVP